MSGCKKETDLTYNSTVFNLVNVTLQPKYSEILPLANEKIKDLKDLTELLPVNYSNYYKNVLETLERNQNAKQNDSGSDEDNILDYTI